MKAGLLSIQGALMLSCILSYSFTVEARLMGFNPNNIRPPHQPALHYDNQVGNPFQYAYIRRSSTMKKESVYMGLIISAWVYCLPLGGIGIYVCVSVGLCWFVSLLPFFFWVIVVI
jgi:hypothetical protein